MVLNLFKYWIKKIIYAVNDTTFYPGVEFYNSKSTLIFKPISIGKGSRLHVIQTTGDYKNIIIGKNCWIGRDVEIQSIFVVVNRKSEVVPFCVKLALSPIHSCLFPGRLTPHNKAIPSVDVLAA